MKKLVLAILLTALLLSVPFSVVDQCYRPEDVKSTGRFYDSTTGTWIQFVPTDVYCIPLNFPDEIGIKYIRLQWRR